MDAGLYVLIALLVVLIIFTLTHYAYAHELARLTKIQIAKIAELQPQLASIDRHLENLEKLPEELGHVSAHSVESLMGHVKSIKKILKYGPDPYVVSPKIWYQLSDDRDTSIYAMRGLATIDAALSMKSKLEGFGIVKREADDRWSWHIRVQHYDGLAGGNDGEEPSRELAMRATEKEMAEWLAFRKEFDKKTLFRSEEASQ